MFEFPALLAFLIHWGYLGIFVGIILGGEILLLAAGFFASLGFFKTSLVILLATLGTLLGDSLWYVLGRTGRNFKFLTKLGKKIGKEKIKQAEIQFKKHSIKTILFIRLIYGLRAMVLIVAGATKMKFFKFFSLNLIGTLIWANIMTFLGYFFGQSILFLRRYIENAILFITLTVILIFLILTLIFFLKKEAAGKV